MQKTQAIKSSVLFPLIKEILDKDKTVTLTVTGNSMYPFLRQDKDSVELVRTSFADIEKNDIVLIKRYTGEYILHRVIFKKENSFYMVGDAQECIEGPLFEDQLIASVKALLRGKRRIACENIAYRLLSSAWLVLRPTRRYIYKVYRLLKRIGKVIGF